MVLFSVLRRKDERDHKRGEFFWSHGPVVQPMGHATFSISHIASRHMSNRVVKGKKRRDQKERRG